MALQTTLRSLALFMGKYWKKDTGPRILCYHGVQSRPENKWSVTPKQFDEQMEWVASECHPVSVSEIVAWVRGETELPANAVAVTFDDGFLDVYENAAPILEKYAVPAAAFIPTGCIESHEHAFHPERSFMSWDQIKQLSDNGWEIGSHTRTHRVLASLDADALKEELQSSKKELEEHLSKEISLLAYPYGLPSSISEQVIQSAKEAGYQAAFMNTIGSMRPHSDLMTINRSKVLGTDTFGIFQGSLDGGMDLWNYVEKLPLRRK